MVTKNVSLWERVKNFRFRETTPLSIADNSGNIVPSTRANGSYGSYGTISYAGYPSEEYLQTLRGTRRADIFDQMRRSDPQIKMCLASVKNPIKSAVWEIEPADDSEEAKADAELIEHILFKDMDQTWIDFLGEALSMIDFGHVVFETIHKTVVGHAKYGAYTGVKSLSFRSQRTLERWHLCPETGELLSVFQNAYGDLNRMVNIPAENLIVMTLEKEGGNYEGISALRACYGPWFRKNNYLKINAIGIEKFAVPTPLVKVPEGKQSSAQFYNMIETLEHYLTHQNNYLTYPEGWEITLNTNTYDPAKVEVSIDNEDKRMVKAFLANFLELGQSGSGSYALSNDLSDFFLSGIDHVAGKIESTLNRLLIPKLIMMNRGQRANYPTLKHSGVSDKAGKELAEVLKMLGETKFITPDDNTESHLRKRYGIPKASDIGKRIIDSGYANSTQTLSERILLSEAKRKRLSDAE